MMLRDVRSIRAVGVGLNNVGGRETGEHALTFFVHKKQRRPRGKHLPKHVACGSERIPVDVRAMPGEFRSTAHFPPGQLPRYTGALAGSAIADQDAVPDWL